ncbi:phosphate transporter [Mortierella sp. GBA39]|nr:phosphate transporter [Mortierella sp. GBA39]
MTPPRDTFARFDVSRDIHYPATLKIHDQRYQRQHEHLHEQQYHLAHQSQHEQQPQQTTIRKLVDKSTRLVKNAYDLILLNLVLPLLSLIYFKHSTSTFHHTSTIIHPTAANTVSFSTLIGQLFFGCLGGAYGRHKFYSLDLVIIIFGTLFCAFSSGDGGSDGTKGGGGTAMIQYLTFWRFVLAFGIGSDYPISATVPSEEAAVTSRRRRGGKLVAILTSIQGLGNLMASIVTLMVLILFRAMIVDDGASENMDMVWRICIAVGCLPALSTALVRLTMPASAPGSGSGSGSRPAVDPRSRLDDGIDVLPMDGVADKVDEENMSSAPDPSFPPPAAHSTSASLSKAPERRRVHATRQFHEYCSQRKNLKVLIGTSLSWFLLDIAFRSIALNQLYLLDALGMTYSSDNAQDTSNNTTTTTTTNKTTLYHHLWMTTLGNLTVSLLGIVPGYWFAIFSIEKIYRKRTQFLGFALLLLFFTLLSTAFHQLKAIVPLFITTFTLSQFFSNLTSSTPFVVPGEVFPTRVRATAHGISAGSGKVGAVLATVMFNRLVEMDSPLGDSSKGITVVGVVFGLVVMTVGFLVVAFVLPRGARRLLSSKLVWSRSSSKGSCDGGGTENRVPHQQDP